ncbi:MAG: two pore domain potassium channel family protein [Deltaproteobacteria bacterium]|nr:two pore domain potassium channel family protein [Deltaproteobacteria bacterium]
MKEQIKSRLRIYLAVFTVLLLTGIIGFMFLENMSLTNAVYFSIVTMATVGYGDLHPQTEIGKILAVIIIIGGVGTFLGVIASITDFFVNRREEAIRQEKIDMVTGLFFSEMGNGLLKIFIKYDPEIETFRNVLKISTEWRDEDFDRAQNHFKKHRISIDSHRADIPALFEYLKDRADLLLRLIENPTIQEHQSFTDLLRALFHLRDELLNRDEIFGLLDSDRRHLENDIARVYRLLIFEWLRYMRYLKKRYGYLFSLAIRTNPFDPEADAVVKVTDKTAQDIG